MRPVFYSDVTAAARALLCVNEETRACLCAQMFREADIADRYVKRLGKAHPDWGHGTLCEVAMRRCLSAAPGFDDLDYVACVRQVLDRLRLRPRSKHL